MAGVGGGRVGGRVDVRDLRGGVRGDRGERSGWREGREVREGWEGRGGGRGGGRVDVRDLRRRGRDVRDVRDMREGGGGGRQGRAPQRVGFSPAPEAAMDGIGGGGGAEWRGPGSDWRKATPLDNNNPLSAGLGLSGPAGLNRRVDVRALQ